MKPMVLALLGVFTIVCAACDRSPRVDPLIDPSLDAGVWRENARRISATLPLKVGAFVPIEGADPFSTSHARGPVFGSSCTYAVPGKQLVVRIEAGDVLLGATEGTNAGAGTERRATKVHEWPGTVEWNDGSRAGEVRLMVARHYIVDVRLVPATSAAETLAVAESIDTSPLEALSLEGVTR